LRGQVRIAIKISKIEALGPPINLLGCFGQKFERTIFERTTLSDFLFLLHQQLLFYNKEI
jgi:hypothetical protein